MLREIIVIFLTLTHFWVRKQILYNKLLWSSLKITSSTANWKFNSFDYAMYRLKDDRLWWLNGDTHQYSIFVEVVFNLKLLQEYSIFDQYIKKYWNWWNKSQKFLNFPKFAIFQFISSIISTPSIIWTVPWVRNSSILFFLSWVSTISVIYSLVSVVHCLEDEEEKNLVFRVRIQCGLRERVQIFKSWSKHTCIIEL